MEKKFLIKINSFRDRFFNISSLIFLNFASCHRFCVRFIISFKNPVLSKGRVSFPPENFFFFFISFVGLTISFFLITSASWFTTISTFTFTFIFSIIWWLSMGIIIWVLSIIEVICRIWPLLRTLDKILKLIIEIKKEWTHIFRELFVFFKFLLHI